MTCNGRTAIDQVVELLEADAETAPECPTCVTPLKPDVVLFGELLPERAMAEAQALAAEADLIVCIGSSLTVYPVAGLPELTRRSGGRIALVTEGETPYDDVAEVKLSGDVVDELEAVAKRNEQHSRLTLNTGTLLPAARGAGSKLCKDAGSGQGVSLSATEDAAERS